MAEPPLRRPTRLAPEHDVSVFKSGRAELDEWLVRNAATSEAKTARTYAVTLGPTRVVGYYTLASGAVTRASLPTAKLRRNTPDPVPVIVLARLATDENFAGRGIGRGMLKEAVARMLVASETVGVRGLVAQAIDEPAGGFYLKFGFLACRSLGSRTFLLPAETAGDGLDVG